MDGSISECSRLTDSVEDQRSCADLGNTKTRRIPMAKKNIHVVKRSSGEWAVERDEAKRASSLADTQREAIAHARTIAKREGLELVVHGENGRIREKNSYGRDPFPPRG